MNQFQDQSGFTRLIGLGLVVLVLILSFLLIRPFLLALLLAWVLAYLFYPLFLWWERVIPFGFIRRELAAVFTCLAIIVLIILPLLLAVFFLARELKDVDSLLLGLSNGINGNFLRLPGFLSERLLSFFQTRQIVAGLISLVVGLSKNIILGLPSFVLSVIITIVAIYYFLIGAKDLYRIFLDYLPLPVDKLNQGLARFNDLCRGMIYGQVVVGAVQGCLAGLAFYLLAVPHALIWGFMTAIISVIPFFGAAMVWLPVAGYLFFVGEGLRAASLFIFGALVISTIDNILKPKIVGHHANVHPLIVLYGILGGIQLFGVAGILVGPFILMIFDLIIEMYRECW